MYTKMHKDQEFFFLQDLCVGEMIHEELFLNGSPQPLLLVALSDVDLAVIDRNVFVRTQSEDTSGHLNKAQKVLFLQQTSFCKNWDGYMIERMANVLRQEEVSKRKVFQFSTLTRSRQEGKRPGGKAASQRPATIQEEEQPLLRDPDAVYFIIFGHMAVVHPTQPTAVLTTLSRFDHFGDAALLNGLLKDSQHVAEEFLYVATTKLEILVLRCEDFVLCMQFPLQSIRRSFLAVEKFRKMKLSQFMDVKKKQLEETAEGEGEGGSLPDELTPTKQQRSNQWVAHIKVTEKAKGVPASVGSRVVDLHAVDSDIMDETLTSLLRTANIVALHSADMMPSPQNSPSDKVGKRCQSAGPARRSSPPRAKKKVLSTAAASASASSRFKELTGHGGPSSLRPFTSSEHHLGSHAIGSSRSQLFDRSQEKSTRAFMNDLFENISKAREESKDAAASSRVPFEESSHSGSRSILPTRTMGIMHGLGLSELQTQSKRLTGRGEDVDISLEVDSPPLKHWFVRKMD